MDGLRFDALTRFLARMPNRRALLSGLAALLGGAVSASTEAGATPSRGQLCLRLGKRCKDRPHRCCGNAKCRRGKCRCNSTQKACQGKCIGNNQCCRDGDCGGNGAVCRQGRCRCPRGERDCNGTCIPNGDCCGNGECRECESCLDGRCLSGCQLGQECVAGTCRCTSNSCDGCCDDDMCRNGQRDGGCGINGAACRECGDHADCVNGACRCEAGFRDCGERCQECCQNSQCPNHEVCVDGVCTPPCAVPGHETAVCATYEPWGDVRCCDGACPAQPTCIATGEPCDGGPIGTCPACCASAACAGSDCRCAAYGEADYSAPMGPLSCAADQDCNSGTIVGAQCRCGGCCLADGQEYGSLATGSDACLVCCSGQCREISAGEYICEPGPG